MPKYKRKGMIRIVPISKEEKKELSERFPKATFVRTMKQDSKRGHYYCVEEKSLMRALNEIRRSNVTEEKTDRKFRQKNK